MNILDKIVAHKKKEIARKASEIPLTDLKQRVEKTECAHRSLIKRINANEEFHFICEVKKASPSAGTIRKEVQVHQQALAYQKGGASAISVLTDYEFFRGSISDLQLVRNVVHLPVLRKDFIIDAYQIYESALIGADLILLIARILTPRQTEYFLKLATELGLEILIELHDPEEQALLPQNLTDFPVMLGINNRNLDTFEVDLQRSLEIVGLLPKHLPVISESGVKTVEQCLKLKAHGFRGVLMGEGLMRQTNPERYLQKMVEAVNNVYAS